MKKLFLFAALLGALTFVACTSGSQLEIAVAQANSECPIDAGDGVVVTKIFTEDNAVVNYCVVEEEEDFSVSDLDDPTVKSIMKSAMIADFVSDDDPDMKDLLDMLKDANYNYVFRYVGSMSNDQVDIVIYPHEL